MPPSYYCGQPQRSTMLEASTYAAADIFPSSLRCLIERMEKTNDIDVDQNEELLMYSSAELQASTDSWVWATLRQALILVGAKTMADHETPRTSMSHRALRAPIHHPGTTCYLKKNSENRPAGNISRVATRYLQQISGRHRYTHNHIQQPFTVSPCRTGWGQRLQD